MKTVIFSEDNLQRFMFESLGMKDGDFNDKITSFINGFIKVNGVHSYDWFYVRTMEDYCFFGMYYDETKGMTFTPINGELDTYKYESKDDTAPIEYITVRGVYQTKTNSQYIVVDVKYKKLITN